MTGDTSNVLVTGGTGGIGRAMARRLLDDGAGVLVTGRDAVLLRRIAAEHADAGDRFSTLRADLTTAEGVATLVSAASTWRGGIDVLVNNAGTASFGLFDAQDAATIAHTLAVNATAPMVLTQALLSHLKSRPVARIVNVGSVFGAIGYPGQVAYSASKFALRGFSEALRRELHGTSVSVHYLAPRATDTAMNGPGVVAMNRKLGVATDSPERVADELARLLRDGGRSRTVGWPEKLFVRLNALWPGLVDRASAKQLGAIRQFAARERGCETLPAAARRPTQARKAS